MLTTTVACGEVEGGINYVTTAPSTIAAGNLNEEQTDRGKPQSCTQQINDAKMIGVRFLPSYIFEFSNSKFLVDRKKVPSTIAAGNYNKE